MRRKDNEITDEKMINEIISDCDCCRLGFNDNMGAYILPMNFGFAEEAGKRVFYFHSAREGRKIELLKEQKYVGFEMDTGHKVNTSKAACGYSFAYQSIIGQGEATIIESNEEKARALNIIMARYSGKGDWEYPEKALDGICVFKLTVRNLECKRHL